VVPSSNVHTFSAILTAWKLINRRRPCNGYTGRFTRYSGITKIYYRKTVEHVFTKPVQVEGTT